jgi:hypothetical protein
MATPWGAGVPPRNRKSKDQESKNESLRNLRRSVIKNEPTRLAGSGS